MPPHILPARLDRIGTTALNESRINIETGRKTVQIPM
jgi:hypothetical protein